MFSRRLLTAAQRTSIARPQQARQARRFFADEAKKDAAEATKVVEEAVKAEAAPAGGPNPMLIGGGVAVVAIFGGIMMMGSGGNAKEEEKVKVVAAGEWGKKLREETPAAAKSTSAAAPAATDLGGMTEDELLAGVKALDARLAGVQDGVGAIVQIHARIARVQEFLDDDGSVDTSALAARVNAAEATLAARAMEADLEDPLILAALERKHRTHTDLPVSEDRPALLRAASLHRFADLCGPAFGMRRAGGEAGGARGQVQVNTPGRIPRKKI